jgi:hypothetical protein
MECAGFNKQQQQTKSTNKTMNEPEKNEQEKRDEAEWQAEMKAHKIEQMHDFLGERETEEEEE